MTSFIAAYLVLWTGLLAYVARMTLKQRQLAQAIAALESRCASVDESAPPAAVRAA
jgi:CcmD family protein